MHIYFLGLISLKINAYLKHEKGINEIIKLNNSKQWIPIELFLFSPAPHWKKLQWKALKFEHKCHLLPRSKDQLN